MQLRPEYEKIRCTTLTDIAGVTIATLVRIAVEKCQELADKPPKELTDAEIVAISDNVEFAKFADDLAFARACIAAHIAKQREPEVVKVKIRTFQFGDGSVLTTSEEITSCQAINGRAVNVIDERTIEVPL